ncbi:MAG: glutamate racemase [Fibrobacter sp.]|jgi:glutamate racemase|uniref:glutamate racemase n=1 Tax=Fibrobacter sp. UWP2 TaxID=1896216 RepID=UPI00091C14C7|nr:glutamate racemase [Fibrobacter sp. UWP2]MBO7384566.1 glutamate racemase [Fibrobacter sp.]MCR5378727.1 glutamate racemase [Fibrobacter sp.]SHJ20982.1 glutamate racemase [Fibrobacter sp. UWP2]
MIGVFDSGFGGLTILRDLQKVLPQYDFMYLGDNARAPYGSRSFETIYRYTLESVRALFARGCPLVILACNTASAKALRSIQQQVLPFEFPDRRVLGIVRPTAEEIGKYSKTGHIGIFATAGTVSSKSYVIEISHFFPKVKVTQHACPMWVPLVECGESGTEGAKFFVKKEVDALLAEDPEIDTVLLACTHYPLLEAEIRAALPPHVRLVFQGDIVAQKTVDYLKRHPEMDGRLTKGSKTQFLTSDTAKFFEKGAFLFGMHDISAESLTF